MTVDLAAYVVPRSRLILFLEYLAAVAAGMGEPRNQKVGKSLCVRAVGSAFFDCIRSIPLHPLANQLTLPPVIFDIPVRNNNWT